jgi:hypothetical protein
LILLLFVIRDCASSYSSTIILPGKMDIFSLSLTQFLGSFVFLCDIRASDSGQVPLTPPPSSGGATWTALFVLGVRDSRWRGCLEEPRYVHWTLRRFSRVEHLKLQLLLPSWWPWAVWNLAGPQLPHLLLGMIPTFILVLIPQPYCCFPQRTFIGSWTSKSVPWSLFKRR